MKPIDFASGPAVERYLHAGELSAGEAALEEALVCAPHDAQTRFGLGVLRFLRCFERLAQSFHEYGIRPQPNVPFLRLPVPENPAPARITYGAFRSVLDRCRLDLGIAEATLSGVTDAEVKLPLRLAPVRLDFGHARPIPLLEVLRRIGFERQPGFLADNPEFRVGFDRGDVAWLRAYCHLLMALLDLYLAIGTRWAFDRWAIRVFARPVVGESVPDHDWRRGWTLVEPARLGRVRQHLIRVAELNYETWEHIRAETDDDCEWLPNPRQRGVLGLPVREEMIDAWLAMMRELHALLEGRHTLPPIPGFGPAGKTLDVRALLDDPPQCIDEEFLRNPPEKYFASGLPPSDAAVLLGAFLLLGNAPGGAVPYALYFN